MSKHILHCTEGGERLLDLIIRNKINMDFPCAGNHTCGKCKIYANGHLSPMTASEAAMLTREEIEAGIRMACFAKADGEVEVELPESHDNQIMSHGKGSIEIGEPIIPAGYYGAAIDIGTTTVVCKLYDAYGKELAVESELNAQRSFGADVISRINYGITNGNEIIHKAIISQLESMLSRLAVSAGIKRHMINTAVVTGNTTMLHFFAGLDPKGIGFVPFIPESLFDCEIRGILGGITAYVPPCVSAYVGADLVCCLLASKMCSRPETSLIIDIGTNGEMALSKEGLIYCCSTAAGPAFEGAGISSGMTASRGAISHVRMENQTPVYDTIGGERAIGLCGSGIIDAVSVMLDGSAVSASGRICREGSPLEQFIDSDNEVFTFQGTNVNVTQEDIRKVQMAKAAINAGVMTLSSHCKIEPEHIDVIYLCGGFGAFLDLHSAENIGLLPPESAGRTIILGNGAIFGAASLLLNKAKIDEIRSIISKCRYIELSDDDEFMDYYVDSMYFRHDEDEEM